MGQMGLCDVSERYAGMDAELNPLVKLTGIVPWPELRPGLEAV